MEKSYRGITKDTANRIKLVMLDVDGTLLASGDEVSPEVRETIQKMNDSGIITGLVSGRYMKQLVNMALELGMEGPVIAENGGVARITPGGENIELGYERGPALENLKKLKRAFPDDITEREDNTDRTIDVVFRSNEISADRLKQVLDDVQLLDSGYILHLMQEGISKGSTLRRLLDEYINGEYENGEVMVFGDSATDLSLFELFPCNVLVRNPNLPDGQEEIMREAANYISEKQYGDGFVEVALHIIDLRT